MERNSRRGGKKELTTEIGLQARTSKSNTLYPLKKADAAGGENHGREWRKVETNLYSKTSIMKAS